MRTLKAEGGEGCTCPLSRIFLRNSSVSSFCAEHDSVYTEILILFHCSTLDQKVKARSLGSFTGTPPTPQCQLKVGCPNSPRSDVTCLNFFFWND